GVEVDALLDEQAEHAVAGVAVEEDLGAPHLLEAGVAAGREVVVERGGALGVVERRHRGDQPALGELEGGPVGVGAAEIALLGGLDGAVAAGRQRAVVAAAVAVDAVAVVALLDALLHDAVAAERLLAGAGAGVGVAEVAVVAFLDAGLHEAVAAEGVLA